MRPVEEDRDDRNVPLQCRGDLDAHKIMLVFETAVAPSSLASNQFGTLP
jgi:hypothetical protein